MNHVLEANDGRWVNADLSRVDEIGWVDLTAGNGHGQGGWAGVGKIEVYGKAVARSGAAQTGVGNSADLAKPTSRKQEIEIVFCSIRT